MAVQPTTAVEVNFDGLVGPGHHYGGLSFGNLASQRHRRQPSSPRQAALQGLAKMKALHDLGLVQGVLPPPPRPDLATLRRLGFAGDDAAVLEQAARQAPQLLLACSSASAMWAANAATVSPSADTADGRIHFTPANLVSQFHRSLEPPFTARLLQTLFADPAHFVHHPWLPAHPLFGDEGAANHSRFCAEYGAPGVAMFVYGHGSRRFPARQTLAASQAVARQHGLDPDRVLQVCQNPEVIDQGVFHNDVIAVGNRQCLFCHQQAFADQRQVLAALDRRLDGQLQLIEVSREQVSVQDAVDSYLFNSQLLTLPDGRALLVVPQECRESAPVWAYLQALLQQGTAIQALQVFDLRQSMRNGGGPACLRLRVVMTAAERQACRGRVWLDEALYQELVDWVGRHYRDRLLPEDLADPVLLQEQYRALDELSRILALDGLYPFQRP